MGKQKAGFNEEYFMYNMRYIQMIYDIWYEGRIKPKITKNGQLKIDRGLLYVLLKTQETTFSKYKNESGCGLLKRAMKAEEMLFTDIISQEEWKTGEGDKSGGKVYGEIKEKLKARLGDCKDATECNNLMKWIDKEYDYRQSSTNLINELTEQFRKLEFDQLDRCDLEVLENIYVESLKICGLMASIIFYKKKQAFPFYTMSKDVKE